MHEQYNIKQQKCNSKKQGLLNMNIKFETYSYMLAFACLMQYKITLAEHSNLIEYNAQRSKLGWLGGNCKRPRNFLLRFRHSVSDVN